MEGFCVVRGPDLLWGQDIRAFNVPPDRFDGIIAGSPCQDFSKARRSAPSGAGEQLLEEFRRLVTESQVTWWLLENVPTVPDVRPINPYTIQRFDLSTRECGGKQSRLRHFQFGFKTGGPLIVDRDDPDRGREDHITLAPCCMASEGSRSDRRSFADFCELQGLPRNFDLPGWSIKFKYSAVGNGVPIYMARVIARSVKNRSESQPDAKICICGCGRRVTGKKRAATPACRKRLERRRRDSPGFYDSRRITL
jgi:DNA (cytosine-5)-methyltransferase 1